MYYYILYRIIYEGTRVYAFLREGEIFQEAVVGCFGDLNRLMRLSSFDKYHLC